jgi:hypothetical protein
MMKEGNNMQKITQTSLAKTIKMELFSSTFGSKIIISNSEKNIVSLELDDGKKFMIIVVDVTN